MAEESEYELLPHEELERLRSEIAKLKQDPVQKTQEADSLKSSIDRLTMTINKFITLMTKTNEELLDQFQQTSFIEQFKRITDNQEQIAKGILSVAKMVKSEPKPEPKPEPSFESVPPIQQNQFSPSQPQYAPPQFQQAPSFDQPMTSPEPPRQAPPEPENLPPPPPHKKGLFHFGK